ncbi:hypothetical protein GGS24DRAFT_133405 [Hypoxylon argillaceum]|nr:hypothetical protein GGS24DRAFT_133405 [Hypoxylon argillaceum]
MQAVPNARHNDEFSRRDALIRHVNSKNKKTAYQCPQCNPSRVFARKENLNQHLRGFHKQGDNEAANPEPQAQLAPMLAAEPLEQAPAYVSHVPHLLGRPLLLISCTEPGCDRQGPDGFVRQEDLIAHVILYHSSSQNSMPYQPVPAYPTAFPMINYYGQENSYSYQQNANNQLMGNPVLGGGYYMNGAGVQGDYPQQFGNYGPAGDLFQFDGFQMNEADGQGYEGNADFNVLE